MLICIAAPLIAFATGIYAGSNPGTLSGAFGSFGSRWATNPFAANEPSYIKLEGRNGLSSTFERNITDAELDAQCLNIELMRQKLRGIGRYKISSKVEGMNKDYISFFPAAVKEEDLDVFLELSDRMRRRVRGIVEVDEVVDIPKERSEVSDVQPDERDPSG